MSFKPVSKDTPIDVIPNFTHALVILFKDSGKYYTEEEWRVPTQEGVLERGGTRGDVLSPYCMKFSQDFRRIGKGKVLVATQEPWGYPHLL